MVNLRFGQPVHTKDGHFGELDDIVIDPVASVVTHVIVQPERSHFQARLVPVRFVAVKDDVVHLDLGDIDLRQLERVAFDDFVQVGKPLDLGEDWDVGFEKVLAAPYWTPRSGQEGHTASGDGIQVAYDRIPKGDCEIRRKSFVLTSDDHVVGTVEGLVIDGDCLDAVVVRTGQGEDVKDVVAPIAIVGRVRTDEVRLTVDVDAFHRLPKATGLRSPDNGDPADDGPATREHQGSPRSDNPVAALIERLKNALRQIPTPARRAQT